MNPTIDYDQLRKRNILCVDMKSFYASCAARMHGLDPLEDYIAVVGDRNRPGGIVLAASPALKKDFGIQTGNRLFEIPKHPHIHIVPAQMRLYLKTSVEITRLLYQYVPKESIHTYSVDETFLEVDGTEKLWGDAETIARSILNDLETQFGLPASIGIGPNMLMAKLCLDLEAKKYGVKRWTYEDVPKKLWPITPLSKMWGIGPRLEKRLNRMGIYTVGDLAHYPLEKLEKTFGIMGNQLYYHANGIDLSELGEPILSGQKSYGTHQILLRDYRKREDILYVILEMCEEVGFRMRKDRKAGRTVQLGIGYSKKEGGGGFYRSLTIDEPTNITMEIYRSCRYLFFRHDVGKTVRKISVSVTNMIDDQFIQFDLFHPNRVKEHQLGYTMDAIREKYGKSSLLRAVSYTEAGTARKRSRLIGGHYAE